MNTWRRCMKLHRADQAEHEVRHRNAQRTRRTPEVDLTATHITNQTTCKLRRPPPTKKRLNHDQIHQIWASQQPKLCFYNVDGLQALSHHTRIFIRKRKNPTDIRLSRLNEVLTTYEHHYGTFVQLDKISGQTLTAEI